MPTPFFADLVRETCLDGGTGPLTPTGAVSGHRRFAGAVPSETMFHYAIAGIAQPAEWETGEGRIDAAGRLRRDEVAASSNGGARVDFTPGLKTIALTVGAGWFGASDIAAAALEASLGTKQPLSTTHGTVSGGQADDLVTARRGAGWVNLPLSVIAHRGADGGFALSGPLIAPAGTAATPGIAFAADGATGLFRPAAGHIALASQGTERLRLSPAGNVGVGTAAPAAPLHLKRSSETLILETVVGRGSGDCYQSWYDPSGRKGYFGYAGADDQLILMNQMNAGLAFGCNNVLRFVITVAGHFLPCFDNSQDLGSGSNRGRVAYFATGAINTSDLREKAWRGAPSPGELAAARRIAGELGFFQWNDAIAEKGVDGARRHFGVRAQAVWAIMADEGLIDPVADGARPDSRYAFLCYDEWEDSEAASAGNRFGVRPDQLSLFLIAAQEARLTALEGAA